MMNWKVGLTDEARNDFRRLDGREKKLIAKQLVKLEKNPFCGKLKIICLKTLQENMPIIGKQSNPIRLQAKENNHGHKFIEEH